MSDHISLFAQWYYRPAARTTGEMLFAKTSGTIRCKGHEMPLAERVK